jgi:hypothetical protein
LDEIQGEYRPVSQKVNSSLQIGVLISTGSVCMIKNNIEQTIDRIFAARRLTRQDQQMLMTMFSSRSLTPSDAALINRVYEALSQGRLRVVD